MYKIVVIGTGNLGKRHVQSILKSKLDLSIECVDISDANNDEIRNYEILGKKEISFFNDLNDVSKNIDLAIIATSSAVRKMMFEELVLNHEVYNIIFEKVLFQKIDDYYYVKEILDRHHIKAWVNCARREWNSWQKMVDVLNSEEILSFDVKGTDWGLACNSIHMLDLLRMIDDDVTVTNTLFDRVVDSKRKGYKELYGKIIGKGNKIKSFSISCVEDSKVEELIEITTADKHWIINEQKNALYCVNLRDASVHQEEFIAEYQSVLTQKTVESIFENGMSNLPTYDVAMDEHIQIIKPMIQFFESKGGEKALCPIT